MVLPTFKTDDVSGRCAYFAVLLSLNYGLMLLSDSPTICSGLAPMPQGVLVIICSVQSPLGFRQAYLMSQLFSPINTVNVLRLHD
jgi:hypothetical protein